MVASLSFATGAYAIVPDSAGQAYKAIPDRNLFGLREPPPQAAPAPPPAPALPKVILTGLSTILGYEMAFLKVQFPAKPGAPAKEESLTLKEGQRDGEIEVVHIDIPKETVQVKNSGTLMPVTFDKLPPTPAPAPGPAAAAVAVAATPPPNMTSNAAMPVPAIPNARTNPFSLKDVVNNRRPIPTRTVRLPAPNSSQTPALPLNGTQPVPPVVPNGTYQPQTAVPQGAVTPAEEQLLQELDRQATQGAPNPAPQ
jgi:hypothetical protein